MLRVDVTRCGSCTTAFLPAMFRYPRCYESVRGSAGPIGSGDAHGIFPFAVLFLSARFRNVSAALSPHAVGWASTSICFYRGIDRLILFAAAGSGTARSSSVWGPRSPTYTRKTADRGSPPRLLGLDPVHSPYPAIISAAAGRSCLGFCLFQVFGHHDKCAHAISKHRLSLQPPARCAQVALPAPIRSWVCGQLLTRCIGHVWSPHANPCNRRPFSVLMRLTPSLSAAISSRPGTTPCVRFCTCRKNRWLAANIADRRLYFTPLSAYSCQRGAQPI
jgi:hypothetical protein